MLAWQKAAVDYIPKWLDYQMRQSEQPGCVIAVAHKGDVVLEQAFGHADTTTGRALTPRHRFRVASHSKSFTAAGILKLREAGKVRLDDPVTMSTGCIAGSLNRRSRSCYRTVPV